MTQHVLLEPLDVGHVVLGDYQEAQPSGASLDVVQLPPPDVAGPLQGLVDVMGIYLVPQEAPHLVLDLEIEHVHRAAQDLYQGKDR